MSKIGLFGKWSTQKITYLCEGGYQSAGDNRYAFLMNLMGGGVLYRVEWDSSNSVRDPDLQELGLGPTSYDGIINAKYPYTRPAINQDGLYIFAGNDHYIRHHSSEPAYTPLATLHYQIFRPELVLGLGWVLGGGGGGAMFTGTDFILPYLPNCLIIYLLTGVNNRSVECTNIKGAWPLKLQTLNVYGQGGTNVLSEVPQTIEHDLPSSLEQLAISFGTVSSNLITDVMQNHFSKCTNIKILEFILGYSETYSSTALNGQQGICDTDLDLTHITTKFKRLGINRGTISNLLINSGQFDEVQALWLQSLTSLNATHLSNIVNDAKTSINLERLSCHSCSKTFNLTLSDTDVPNIVAWYSYGNIITGDISLTSPRTLLTAFKLGNSGTSIVAPSSKNLHTNVDISGLTNALTIDLSNSRIENLELPVNTVIQNLSLGGNKLDTTINTNLVSQITAMVNLVNLELSAGVPYLNKDIENGQNSVNGFGVLDLSSLVDLVNFYANNIKLSGNITLPESLITFYADNNNLTGISGVNTLPSLTTINTSDNVNFDFDFTRVPSIRGINASNCNLSIVDLSQRTSTLSFFAGNQGNRTSISVQNNPNLTTFKFPSSSATAVFSPANSGTGNTITIYNCPLLSSLQNIENVNYTLVTNGALSFWAYGCSLDMDFKFGITNVNQSFIPTNIQLQDNGMSQSNVDINIDNIYQNIIKWKTSTSLVRALNIAGTNAAPSGIYQAPSGYKSAVITSITKASVAVVTVSSIGSLANDDVILIRAVGGMTQVNFNFYMIKNISGNTFELYDETGTTPINSSAFGTYTSGGSCYVEGLPSSIKEKTFILVNVWAWTITQN